MAEDREVIGRFAGRVALITGAAQGQGRRHAVRLAEEGADVIAVDIARQLDVVPYGMGTAGTFEETAELVRATGRRILTAEIDVRDREALHRFVEESVAEFGRLDVVAANAAVMSSQRFEDVTPEIWDTTIGVNLTGVWNTCTAAIPHLIATGGGSIVITNSTAGLRGLPFLLPYVASKHALVGVARTLALELADRNIRVNTLHPTAVDTPMAHSGRLPGLLKARPDLAPAFGNALPIAAIDPIDVTNALLFLASDEARYITGATLTVDAGATLM
ncbi:MAG TPA: mycofactocin-coupled SDR family oxidoreductase [Jatrophihabitans sp.]|jgi:SDR family mycofactocin-dependent oxidoreductase